jgi:hypothetical protein
MVLTSTNARATWQPILEAYIGMEYIIVLLTGRPESNHWLPISHKEAHDACTVANRVIVEAANSKKGAPV